MNIVNNITLEACTESFQSSLLCQQKGASRIELCENLLHGGTTPSYGTIKACLNLLNIPISVMVRPRGGNFTYTKEEIEIMKSDIEICKKLNAYGVVFGVLNQDQKSIDLNTTQELVQCAKPLKITFHMAFDEIDDIFQGLEQLVNLQIDRILTKGGKFSNALEGKKQIKDLIEKANNRIIIMPGKGINKDNYQEIVEYTGAREVHGTQIV
ncbi:hypothetical protein IMG5_116420 [Ichthyophthirius multifiliis]|uniref:Copper homeostasis protein cutC homolog n=1 Tax=Ichthyophthirius multifiliis TaxID=5932 RepID=G0QUD4_ICHMU|nr:hypothetical protein IMG5_116420 [Ichthyophthirius multifiliis]EGR31171.1 hypothetical protein IMG5_116420 [Ichthyophthirius multifiliis]|eukprot:XP_004034657.1 hypothetical protein IMG5_116420 [Ichthyophthirius multifiliis]